MFVFVVLV